MACSSTSPAATSRAPAAPLGGISFSGSPNITLHPATTGTYAGITFFQARDNNLAVTFSSRAQYGVNGFLYAPNALLNLTGSISTVRMGVIVDRLNTSGNATSGLVTSGTASEDGQPAGEFLTTSLSIYVNDPFSQFTAAERARITSAITSIDSLIAPFNVDVYEVSDPALANVVIKFAATTVLGGMVNGVLAAFDPVQTRSRWSTPGTGTPAKSLAILAPTSSTSRPS